MTVPSNCYQPEITLHASTRWLVFTPNLGPAGVLVLWDDYTCEKRIIP